VGGIKLSSTKERSEKRSNAEDLYWVKCADITSGRNCNPLGVEGPRTFLAEQKGTWRDGESGRNIRAETSGYSNGEWDSIEFD